MVDRNCYVDVNPLFVAYTFATGGVLGLLPSWVAKRHCSDSKTLLSVRGLDVVLYPGLAFMSMESGHA